MKKNKDIELYKKIKDVLIKKAEGYFYNEEILEYQTEDGKTKKVTTTSNQTDTPTENEEKCEEGTDTKKEDKLTLSKKKITTHYIPPDLLAVKMLFEIYGEKIESTNELEKLEYQELLNIKKQLLEKLKEED
ncbi:MAG: hypothetical protein IJB98_03315 [Clostridia bacterium]|nr:hypothetical protein [Clostridia bacterium]